jgi:subtilisin family serine protease
MVYARLEPSGAAPWANPFVTALDRDERLRVALGGPTRWTSAVPTWSTAIESVLDLRNPRDPRFAALRWIELQYSNGSERPDEIVSFLRDSGRFDLVGIVPIRSIAFTQSSSITDPLYAFGLADPHKHQWALDQGRFRQAFGFSEGRALVGALDQGIDPQHPDLVANLRRHMVASVDRYSLGAGQIDHGYFPQTSVVNDTTPGRQSTTLVGHGLHVAGIIAASKDNQGTSGACPGCSLAALRTLYQTETPRGLQALVNLGVAAVSMSFSMTNRQGSAFDEQRIGVALMYDLLVLADAYDTVLVGAMGNDRLTTRADSTVVFPFPGALPFVLGVGATDVRAWRWEEKAILDHAPLAVRHPLTNYSDDGSNRVALRCDANEGGSLLQCGSNEGRVDKPSPFSVFVVPGQSMIFPAGIYGIDVVAPGAQVLSTMDRAYTPFACYGPDVLPSALPPGAQRCQPPVPPAFPPPPWPLDNVPSFPPNRNLIGNSAVGAYVGAPFTLPASYANVPGNAPLPSTYNGYGVMTGTSMATPHVAALAGLIRSVIPLLSASETRKAVLQGADRSAARMAVPPGRGSWTDQEVGQGLIDAEASVQRALGQSNAVQLQNRLTPVLTLTSNSSALPAAGAGSRAWLYTTSPQAAMAAVEGRFYNVVDPPNGPGLLNTITQPLPESPIENDFGTKLSVAYTAGANVGTGASLAGYYAYPVPYKSANAIASASFLLFSTPYNIKSGVPNALVPLYRMSMKCNQVRKHFYTVSASEAATYAAGPESCGADAAPPSQGYNLDGIEGYLYPVGSPSSHVVDAEALYRKYSPTHKAWALVLAQEEANLAYASYTQNRTLLGYVYPIITNGHLPTPAIVDGDGDGLFTVIERHLVGTNESVVDTDNDGQRDGDEYRLDRLPSDPRL